jgi:hypothetical protein
MAKEVTLRDGQHLPTVIADGSAQTAIVQLAELPNTHEGRAQQMYMTGFLLADSRQIGKLKQVFFISEAWMSTPREGELPTVPPSQDPNRKEILVISAMRVPDHDTKMAIFEMLRSQEGQLTDLKEYEPVTSENTDVDSPLLRAFAAGFDEGTSEITRGILN